MIEEEINWLMKIIALSIVFNPFTIVCIACLILLIIIIIKSKK